MTHNALEFVTGVWDCLALLRGARNDLQYYWIP